MNYMDKVAEMLGVKLNEEFNLKYKDGRVLDGFTLSEKGLIRKPVISVRLQDILTGECEIVKLPWKPKEGEPYCSVTEEGNIEWNRWWAGYKDIALYALGNYFPTEAEAEKHKPEMLAKMKEVMEK